MPPTVLLTVTLNNDLFDPQNIDAFISMSLCCNLVWKIVKYFFQDIVLTIFQMNKRKTLACAFSYIMLGGLWRHKTRGKMREKGEHSSPPLRFFCRRPWGHCQWRWTGLHVQYSAGSVSTWPTLSGNIRLIIITAGGRKVIS